MRRQGGWEAGRWDSPAPDEVRQVVDQQLRQVLVGHGVIGRVEENGHDLSAEERYAQEVGDLLAPLARSIAKLEMQEVAPSAGRGVQQRQPQEGRRDLAVAQKGQKALANDRRAQLAPLPVRVLVTEGRVDLVQVITVGVPHVGAQNTVPPGLVQAVLQTEWDVACPLPR